jgi:hypothetical protein
MYYEYRTGRRCHDSDSIDELFLLDAKYEVAIQTSCNFAVGMI